MTGGIYCEVPLGTIYEERLLGSVNKRTLELIGPTDLQKLLDKNTIKEIVINYWYNNVSKKMSKILSSWKVPGNRGYYNRTVDLTRSICLGVFYRGKLERMYRFTGGHRELAAIHPSDMGTGISYWESLHLGQLSKYHPNPASRAIQFLKDYKLIYLTGYTLVIAATMPYAVRLEKQYALPVLSQVINRVLASVYEFKNSASNSNTISKGAPLYGYIFESTGVFA